MGGARRVDADLRAAERNLATLTQRGLLRPLGDLTREVVARVTSQSLPSKGRGHPFAMLVALRTDALGRSLRGDATWEPVGEWSAALGRAYEPVWRKRGGRLVREIQDAPPPITCADSRRG